MLDMAEPQPGSVEAKPQIIGLSAANRGSTSRFACSLARIAIGRRATAVMIFTHMPTGRLCSARVSTTRHISRWLSRPPYSFGSAGSSTPAFTSSPQSSAGRFCCG